MTLQCDVEINVHLNRVRGRETECFIKMGVVRKSKAREGVGQIFSIPFSKEYPGLV